MAMQVGMVQPMVSPMVRRMNDGILPFAFASMPLVNDLSFSRGIGPADHTRSTIATFEDFDTKLVTTAAIDAARFESPSTAINRKFYKHEGPSDNLALRSEEIDDAAWSKIGGITFAANQSTGADGLQTADQITYIGGQGSPSTRGTQQAVTVPGGTASKTFTVSYWVESVSGTSKFRFNNTHGGVQANFSPDITATTTLTRFDFTVTNGVAAGTGVQFIGLIAATDDSAYDLRVWGYQFEEKRSATSYIKTLGIPVTRETDILQIPVANVPADADFTISVTAVVQDVEGSAEMLWALNGPGSTRVFMTATPTVRFDYNIDGNASPVLTFDTVFRATMAYSKTNSNFNHYIDGVKDVDAPVAVTPNAAAITNIFLGGNNAGAQPLYGHLTNARVDNITLDDEQAAVA